MRSKIDVAIGSKKVYSQFLDENPKAGISYTVYKSALIYMNTMYGELFMRESPVKLPSYLGYAGAVKSKPYVLKEATERLDIPMHITEPSKHRIDYRTTKDTEKLTVFTNEHSDGWGYYFIWVKKEANLALRSIWKMKMCRNAKRKFAQYIKGKEEFVKAIPESSVLNKNFTIARKNKILKDKKNKDVN